MRVAPNTGEQAMGVGSRVGSSVLGGEAKRGGCGEPTRREFQLQ